MRKISVQFRNNQYDFMGSRSTQDPIAALTPKIYSAINSREKAVVHLSKAFDTLSYPVLLQKFPE